MKGTLVSVCKDDSTGLTYGIYLIRHRNRLWLATFDAVHGIIAQVQEVTLSEERLPEEVKNAMLRWLL